MSMKVWVLTHDSYGEVSVYAEDTDIFKIKLIEDELSYLVGAYDEELEEFKADIDRAKTRGYGSATIEERFTITLEAVR